MAYDPAKAIETPVEAKSAIAYFLMNRVAAIPDDIRDRLQQLALEEPSPVVAGVEAAELIYARADELPPELLEIGAQIAAMSANYNFHGMREDNRGFAMAATLRKKPGVVPVVPDPSTLEPPAPSDRHRPPVTEPTPEPAPAPAVAAEGAQPTRNATATKEA